MAPIKTCLGKRREGDVLQLVLINQDPPRRKIGKEIDDMYNTIIH